MTIVMIDCMTIILYAVKRLEAEMKVSREQASENRQRIVEVASQLFREHGFDGIGVADLMKGAGLTHGGFYGHFSGKEQLINEACARALGAARVEWEKWAAAERSIPEAYLTKKHCHSPGRACLLATLGSDVARQGPAVRQTFTEGVRGLAQTLAQQMPGQTEEERHQQSLAQLASMVGALLLARGVDDPSLAEELLEAGLKATPRPSPP